MSMNTKAGLIALGTLLATTALNWVAQNVTSLGIPSTYLPLVAGLVALATHFLPTPKSTAIQLSTSAQK